MDKVDILLTTYNGERYLKEQIDSILNQTYTNFNLIISDDCSTDGTIDILKEYEKQDERIKVYLQDNNLGYVKNFEFLLKQVQSPYYALSDQDDVWLPEKIEKSMAKLKKEDADLVFGDLKVVDKNLNTIYESFNDFMLLSTKINKFMDSYKLNYLYNCITGCTTVGKSSMIKQFVPIPTESRHLIHDHWIGIIISLKGKVTYIPEKLILYRQHGKNQVGTDKISHKYQKIQDIKKLFIAVKMGIFGTYVKYEEKFPEELQKFNRQAQNYYNMLGEKRWFNFRNWKTFHKLYKDETFMYYIENFAILNLTGLANIIFKARYLILKIQGKR